MRKLKVTMHRMVRQSATVVVEVEEEAVLLVDLLVKNQELVWTDDQTTMLSTDVMPVAEEA